VDYTLENAVFQWEEGFRALERARAEPGLYRRLGRAVVAIEDELRKRLGSTFSIAELAAVYREGADWALEVALAAGPESATPLDSATVVDAAFYLYMREASDFAGGSQRARR
jgi:hypothetical protein